MLDLIFFFCLGGISVHPSSNTYLHFVQCSFLTSWHLRALRMVVNKHLFNIISCFSFTLLPPLFFPVLPSRALSPPLLSHLFPSLTPLINDSSDNVQVFPASSDLRLVGDKHVWLTSDVLVCEGRSYLHPLHSVSRVWDNFSGPAQFISLIKNT